MESPLQPVTIVTVFLLFVVKIGPSFMKNRKPFDLKTVLVVYNLSQIVLNASLFLQVMSGQHLKKVSIFANSADNLDVESYTHIMSIHQQYFLLKLYDLADTIFMVLRKKHQQISFLHVYHHTSIFLLSWTIWKYISKNPEVPTGPSLFFGLCNTFVHIFMYTYYLFSCLGMTKNVLWCKKCITSLQLIQHYFVLFVYIIAFTNSAGLYPKSLMSICVVDLILLIYLFTKFYQKSYMSKNEVKQMLVSKYFN